RSTYKLIGDEELRAVVKRVLGNPGDSDELKLGTIYALDALMTQAALARTEYHFSDGAPFILREAKDKLAFDMGAGAAYFVRDNLADQPDLLKKALAELEDFANKTMDGPNYHGTQGTALKKAVVEVKQQLGTESPNKGWRP